jgi:hypothetical protein
MTEQNSSSKQENAEVNKGIDNWNDRLDRNLEPEQHAHELADIRAEEFSDEKGSGDQSDESAIGNNAPTPHDSDDNMAKNHPHFNADENLDREE